MSDDITVEECLDLLRELAPRLTAAGARAKTADEEYRAAREALQAVYDELTKVEGMLRVAALKEAGFK